MVESRDFKKKKFFETKRPYRLENIFYYIFDIVDIADIFDIVDMVDIADIVDIADMYYLVTPYSSYNGPTKQKSIVT